MNTLLGNAPPEGAPPPLTPNQVLERLERGEISAKDAAQLLKGTNP